MSSRLLAGAAGVARACAAAAVVTHEASPAKPNPKPYRNPTAGSALVLQFPGMHRARVRRDLCTLGFSIGTAPWYLRATMLRRHGAAIAPMLVAKAGREHNAGSNASIDRFVAAARLVGADVRLVTHARGVRGFDISNRDARGRAIIRETLAFFRARLR